MNNEYVNDYGDVGEKIEKKKKGTIIIIIVALVLLLLCVGCGCLGACSVLTPQLTKYREKASSTQDEIQVGEVKNAFTVALSDPSIQQYLQDGDNVTVTVKSTGEIEVSGPSQDAEDKIYDTIVSIVGYDQIDFQSVMYSSQDSVIDVVYMTDSNQRDFTYYGPYGDDMIVYNGY